MTYNGIRGYRYSIRDDFLNDIPDCFCIDKIKDALTDDIGCLYSGALDLTECLGEMNDSKDFNEWILIYLFTSDAPVVATMPHFLNADARYGFMVDGLNPVSEKHGIFIDVETHTGTPLRGGKKLQFNMFLKKIDQISKIIEKIFQTQGFHVLLLF